MLFLFLIVLAIVAGLLRGGSLVHFAALPLRWIGLILASLALQLFLFTPFLGRPLLAVAVEPLYLLSMGMAIVWVALNRHIPGMLLAAGGLALNTLAIAANGGRMPLWQPAAQLAGEGAGFAAGAAVDNNSLLAPAEQVRLWALTDIIPIPQPLPFATVFSIGDALLAAGVMYLCYRTTLRPPAI